MSPDITSSPAISKPPLRVAVIEDDRIMRSLLEKLIKGHAGFSFAGAWATQ